jgi:uncharacterized phosphosugar-binding protein
VKQLALTFPRQLDKVRDGVQSQEEKLTQVASCFAKAIARGGMVHVYANGHSRVTVEELCVRMGALTGFHPVLAYALSNFTDVVGADSLRLNQALEKVEGLGAVLLDEFDIAADEPLIVVSATGQTQAAVDIAIEFNKRYPDNPIIAICSLDQSRDALPKHSSGKTLFHVIGGAKHGFLLDNCMPMGDVSIAFEGKEQTYKICPLSNIGALTIVHSLNELTIQALDAMGVRHHVLQNMHLAATGVNYDAWLADQRERFAKSMFRPDRLKSQTQIS